MAGSGDDAETQRQIDRFMRRLKIALVVTLLALFLPIAAYTFVPEPRFDNLRDTLRYQPPAESDDNSEPASSPPSPVGLAGTLRSPVRGQLIYVPVYSHVYHQDGKPHLLTVTLSVRNTSPDEAITVRSVNYYDTKGQPLKSYLKREMRLGPLATGEFLISKDESSGGSGANFLVEWDAEETVSPPVVEAVMIDTSSQQGISFVRSGVVVRETGGE